MKDDVSGLTNLGSAKTVYGYSGPDASMLETFPNKFVGRDYWVRLDFSEFTSLCPKTGQPDFATLKVEYVPGDKCVETKSLKLYLFAYRNEGSFMETIANRILNDLVHTMSPKFVRVSMSFNPRGGVSLSVVVVHPSSEGVSNAEPSPHA